MMIKSTKPAFLFTLLFFTSIAAIAQDPHFSQFYANPVYTNPAMAGTSKGGRATFNYRNQWPGLPGTFVTTGAAYDQYFQALRGGIGLMAVTSKAGQGILTSSNYNGIYAFEQKLGEKLCLRVGIQAGFHLNTLDFSKITLADMSGGWGLMFDSTGALLSGQKSFANLGSGLLIYSERFYAGFAVHNITEPNQSFSNSKAPGNELPRRYTLNAGVVIPLDSKKDEPLNERFTITPNLLLMMQKEFNQANISIYMNYKRLVTGMGMRVTSENPDAVIGILGYRVNKLTFAYSYDITVSDARAAATGSHEISMALRWKSKRSEPETGRIICPNF